jgi:Fe-S cluster assembly iron-binding protein IscA
LKLSLEERPITGDQVIPIEGVDFLIQKQDRAFFEDTQLDYSRDVRGNGRFQLLKN